MRIQMLDKKLGISQDSLSSSYRDNIRSDAVNILLQEAVIGL